MHPYRSIHVTGEASVEAPPDFAQVTLGVSTTAKEASKAMAGNAEATTALIATLKSEGIAAADIQTSRVSVSRQFFRLLPRSTKKPSTPGYVVGNMVTVTVRDLPRLGPLLDRAVGSGANTVHGVSFGRSNQSALLAKARPLALAEARRKAEIYAAAAGTNIGRLIDLSEQAGMRFAPIPRRVMFAMESADMAASTPIEAGEDKFTVTVTARYELSK